MAEIEDASAAFAAGARLMDSIQSFDRNNKRREIMEFNLLVAVLAAVAVVMMWVGFRLREWAYGDVNELVERALSQAIEDIKASVPIEGNKDLDEAERALMRRIGQLETNDAKRQEGISSLSSRIFALEGRVTTLEEKKDPLGELTEILEPVVDRLKKP